MASRNNIGHDVSNSFWELIQKNHMPTDVGAPPLPSLNFAVNWLLDRLYWGIPLPQTPVTEKHIPKDERNELICERYAEGESLESIGAAFGLSVQCVHQIVHRWCD